MKNKHACDWFGRFTCRICGKRRTDTGERSRARSNCGCAAHRLGIECLIPDCPDCTCPSPHRGGLESSAAGPEDFGGSDECSHYCAQTRIEFGNFDPRQYGPASDGLKALRPNLDDPYERLTAPRGDSAFELASKMRPSAFADSVLSHCAESRIAWTHCSADDWYEAQRYLLAQRAPA